jgi:hypothetical protein
MTFSYRTVYLALIASCLVTLQAVPGFAQSRYFNVRNDKFATVSSGPQSALVVDAVPGETDAAHQARIRSVLSANWNRQGRALQGSLERFRKSGVIKPRSTFAVSTVVLERSGGRLVTQTPQTRGAGGRAFGGGALTFRFTGFTSADVARLRPFVDLVYPRIVDRYGAPAITGEVEIVNSGESQGDELTVVQLLAFGAYNASTNQILLPRYSDDGVGLNLERMYPALLLNMVHAFHGPAVLQYDAWEQGMARAAATVIARDPAVRNFLTSNGVTFFAEDPSAANLLSVLKYYELLNQPALGNRTFFPPSQANSLENVTISSGKCSRSGWE